MMALGYTIAGILLVLATAMAVGLATVLLLVMKGARPDLLERRPPPGD